jgi:hypothetical protein
LTGLALGFIVECYFSLVLAHDQLADKSISDSVFGGAISHCGRVGDRSL